MYIYEALVFLYKHREIIEDYHFTHNYETRQGSYVYPQHRLTLFERTFLYSSIRFHNKLPRQIKESEHLFMFRRKLFNYLRDIEPYSIAEFVAHAEAD